MSKKYDGMLNLTRVFVTALIAWSFLFGGLMGIFVTTVGSGSQMNPEPQSMIPEIINGTAEVRENKGVINHDGSLTITGGGSLTLINSTLNFEQTNTTGYTINVNNIGGASRLTLINSTITASAAPRMNFQPTLAMTLDQSTFEMKDHSALAFPGNLDFLDSVVYINDSWITSPWADVFDSTAPDDIRWVQQFPTFNTTAVRTAYSPNDDLDDGPIIYFENSDDVTIADSRIDEMYETEVIVTTTMSPNLIGAPDNTTAPITVANETVYGPAAGGELGPYNLTNTNLINATIYTSYDTANIVNNETVYGPALGGETGPFNLANTNIINATIYTSNGSGVWNLTTEGADYTINYITGQITWLGAGLIAGDTVNAAYNWTSRGWSMAAPGVDYNINLGTGQITLLALSPLNVNDTIFAYYNWTSRGWSIAIQGADYNINLASGQITLLALSPLNVNDTIFAYYNYSFNNAIGDFIFDDDVYYDVAENKTMWIDGFDVGTFIDSEWDVDDVSAFVIYDSRGTNVSGDVSWSRENAAASTLFTPSSYVTEAYLEASISGVGKPSEIADLNITWFNFQPSGDGTGYGGIELLQLNVTLTLIGKNNDNMFYLSDSNISIINSYISTDYTGLFGPAPDYEPHSQDYNKFMLESNSHLFLYNVTVENDDDGDGNIDYITPSADTPESNFLIYDTSEAYYYKWLDVNVIDTLSNPVEGAEVSATFSNTNAGRVEIVRELNDLSDGDLVLKPNLVNATNDTTTGNSVTELQMPDSQYYEVDFSQIMWVDDFDTQWLDASDTILDVQLRVTYNSTYNITSGYNGTNSVLWEIENGTLTGSAFQPANNTNTTTTTFNLFGAGVNTFADIQGLNVTFENNDGDGDAFDEIKFDEIVLVVTVTPQNNGADARILDYLNRTSGGMINGTNYDVTDSNGYVQLPLLTTIFNYTNLYVPWEPNGDHVGEYSLDIRYWDGSAWYTQPADTVSADFVPYPEIEWEKNHGDLLTVPVSTPPRVTLDLLALPTPDLTPGAITFFPDEPNVIIGDNVIINVTIDNIGPTNALDVYYEVYDSYPGNENLIWMNNISSVPASGSVVESISWTADPGVTHYFEVRIDPFDTINEGDESNNNNTPKESLDVKPYLPELEVGQADIILTPNPVSVGNQVQIDAIIHNTGLENATAIDVRFYSQNPDAVAPFGVPDTGAGNFLIGTDTININWEVGNYVDPDVIVTASTTWTPTNDTDVDIYVWVDALNSIEELREEITNNLDSNNLQVDPKPNLHIQSDWISFTGGLPVEVPATPITINAMIQNDGGLNTTVPFDVEFYYDDNTLIGTDTIAGLNIGEFKNASVIWTPTTKGYHDIKVIVDSAAVVDESDETDNTATTKVLVHNTTWDLIVDNTNNASDPYEVLSSYDQKGYVLVHENGVLDIKDSDFLMLQVQSGQFEITVRDNGTLRLDNSEISTNGYAMTMYLEDNAVVYINDSITDSLLNIISRDNAKVFIGNSEIRGNVDIIGTTANVRLDIEDSTLSKPLDGITGTSIVNLTAVVMSSPTISTSDSAAAYIYRYLNVTVEDKNGYPLEHNPPTTESWVDLNYSITKPYLEGLLHRFGTTDNNGKLVFKAMSDIITPDVYPTSQPVGNYMVNANYTFNAIQYKASEGVTLPNYPSMSSSDNYIYLTIRMDNVRPDLDPPLSAQPDTVGRGETVWLNTTIENRGASPASNILVRFRDETTNELIEDVYIATATPLPPFPISGYSQEISITTSWNDLSDITINGGHHNVSVYVDPYNTIKEFNETNNTNWVDVYVEGRPDVTILSSANILVSPSALSRVVNSPITFEVTVTNVGEVAANNVPVHIYDEEGGALIGNTTIALINSGTSVISSPIQWINPTVSGTYNIYVVLDQNDTINEFNETNNNMTISVTVLEYSDLWIPSLEFVVGGNTVTTVDNRTQITIRARVYNMGGVVAKNVVVDFYDDDEWIGADTNIPDIGGNGGNELATLTYLVEGSSAGTSEIHTMEARASGNLYENVTGLSYSNIAQAALTVDDPRPDLLMISGDGINVETKNITENMRFDVNATIYNNGTGSVDNVTVLLYYDNVTADKLLGSVIIDSLNGMSNTTVFWTQVGPIASEGNHTLFVVIDPDTNSTDNFTVGTVIYDLLGVHEEYNENNNEYNNNRTNLTVLPSIYEVLISSPQNGEIYNLTDQDNIYIQGRIVKAGTIIGVPDIPVSFVFNNRTYWDNTSLSGDFSFVVNISEIPAGDYSFFASAEGEQSDPVTISLRDDRGGFNWFFIIIMIIIIVVVMIAAVTAYLYFFGLGKTVECGNCGAFIPESASKCPKCGTEFETETAKCSVCGAWVPMEAKTCPECESEFTIGDEEAPDYEAKMKKQYDEVVDGFKEQAKKELGPKYSEKEFQVWWAAQPTFITFQQWLNEEEEMKRLGSKDCPNCATPNSVTATICHKCGTVMEGQEQAEPMKEEAEEITEPKAEDTSASGAAAAVAPVAAAAKPDDSAEEAPQKKKCPSCGMELGIDEKTCPICAYDFKDEGGAAEPPKEGGRPPVQKKVVTKKSVVKKPVRKVVRRPVQRGGGEE